VNIAVRAQVPLGDFMLSRGGSTDPSRQPNDPFVLYSIPAFDIGQPEFVRGGDIGSPKKNVRSGDVLLSRIVPHIRRSWIVGEHPGKKILASGEWIVFRSDKIHAPYLRHFLVSEIFHQQFMRTVAGIGGSLLRANPNYVSEITIPLPPLEEQRRIAAILDKTDALRRKCKRAVDVLDGLTQSIFLEMFGDPIEDSRYPTRRLYDLVESDRGISYGIVQRGEDLEIGTKVLRISDIVDGHITGLGLKQTAPEIADKFRRTKLVGGEIVISIRGTVGRCAVVPGSLSGANVSREIAVIPTTTNRLNPFYLSLIRTDSAQRRLARDVKGVAQSGINLEDLRELPIILPPQSEIESFLIAQSRIQNVELKSREQSGKSEFLFSSLQYRAFSGQL
jgi:type I restriction enzyme, S subunit